MSDAHDDSACTGSSHLPTAPLTGTSISGMMTHSSCQDRSGTLTLVQTHDDEMPPLEALAIDLYGRPTSIGVIRIVALLVGGSEARRVLTMIRLLQYCHIHGWRRIGDWTDRRLRRDYGCFIQRGATMGPGLKLPHPTGIVLGSGARIGANCVVYHQVTLGGAHRGDWQAGRYPTVGDGVTLFSGAKLLGAIHIGDGAVIGANAVVTADVPARHVAKGVPARATPLR